MTRVLVPYHLDERLPDLDLPVEPQVTVTATLPDGDAWQRMARLYDTVADTVARAVADGGGPQVVLSGDCTTSLGVVAGLQRAGVDPAVVWFDGHGDVQTMETTGSGYLGGMPLRILVGYRPELIAASLGLRPVPERDVLLVDARDLDPPEVEYLDRAEIRRCDVADVSAATLPDGPIYLHLDADVVDPGDLDGLLFPAPGGPSLTAVADALGRVVDSGRVAAFTVACTWHPGRGAAARVRQRVVALLERLGGAR
jgi:arginase